MSGADGTCEYVLDPDDPETWGGEEGDECYVDEEFLNENGLWICPHGAEEGEDLCIFHLPIGKKDDQRTAEAFSECITGTDSVGKMSESPEFLGAEFGHIRLNNIGSISGFRLQCSRIHDSVEFRHVRFTGFVDLSQAVFEDVLLVENTEFDYSVDLSRTTLNDGMAVDDATFHSDVSFFQAHIEDELNVQDTEFKDEFRSTLKYIENELSIQDTEFKDEFRLSVINGGESTFLRTSFQEASFGGFHKAVYFRKCVFNSKANFRGASFPVVPRGEPEFENVIFRAEADFRDTTFGADDGPDGIAELSLKNVVFNELVRFWDAVFHHDVSLYSVKAEHQMGFRDAVFEGSVRTADVRCQEAFFNDVSFNGQVCFSGLTITDSGTFVDANFAVPPNFVSATLRNCDFSNQNLKNADFERTDLSEAKLTNADLRYANCESALFSRASLFRADLRGAKLSGAVLGDVRIDEETKFLGHPSDDRDTSPHTFTAIRSRLTCVYDPGYEERNEHADVDKAKSVYRALEELGGKHARPRLQARSFVRRQDLQKQDYRDDATADDAALEERLIAGARWSRAKVARATLLYGESPWRVIAWSFGIIFSFALLYPLGGWMKPTDGDPITYAQIASNPVEILNAVYYSTLTYTALGFGDFQPVGLGRLLTTLETGLGAVMLALLVFILGRRAAR
ncbi:pentapeptide repeat-containing protein [Halobellus ruber]|uniref:Pentapeptide repeat-containing protein n=1 Tax=Halobellus ruber TaxID=2761102 RepID=A0A7J9SFD3_9EURY|nr:pentapeptide repeat-containing protein [Halobellus ruber]MBB6645640.1 pentapeptide repeat-containing protein [Halobellus ruber]